MSSSPAEWSALRSLQPESAIALERMRDSALETDPELLALCRRRVASMLEDGEDEWSEEGLSERDKAFVGFAEQFVFAVASIGDRDVEALLAHAEQIEVYRFIAALYSLEMTMRVEIAGAELLGGQGGSQ